MNDRRRSSASRWVALLTGSAVLTFGVVSTVQWALIPFDLDTTVVSTGFVDRTSGHLRTLELADGRTLAVHQEWFQRAGESEGLNDAAIHKSSWNREVEVDGRTVPLRIPLDAWRTLAAFAFLLALGWWLRGAACRHRA